MVEIFTFEVLHDQVGLAGFRLPEVDDGDKVRVPRCDVISASRWNRARASRLAARSRAISLIATRLLSLSWTPLVHGAHAALAEQPRDAVRASSTCPPGRPCEAQAARPIRSCGDPFIHMIRPRCGASEA